MKPYQVFQIRSLETGDPLPKRIPLGTYEANTLAMAMRVAALDKLIPPLVLWAELNVEQMYFYIGKQGYAIVEAQPATHEHAAIYRIERNGELVRDRCGLQELAQFNDLCKRMGRWEAVR